MTERKRRTPEEITAAVLERAGNEFEVLSEYTMYKEPMTFFHKTCGTTFKMRALNFLDSELGCKHCIIERRKKTLHEKFAMTNDEFEKRVFELVGEEYTVLSEYVNSKIKVKIKHNSCGKIHNHQPGEFLIGTRCPSCVAAARGKSRRVTKKQFLINLTEKHGNDYEMLSEYVSYSRKVTFKHRVCGYEYKTTPSELLTSNRGCAKCAGVLKKTTADFKREVRSLEDNEYSVMSEYKTSRTKLLMKHNECLQEYWVTPTNFLSGKRCPICKASKGEVRVRKFLELLDVTFKEEFRIDECKYIKVLRFDFAIFENDKLVALIEYDGMQHFIEAFEDGKLEITQKRDTIKNEYCEENNIPLLRIPYTKYEKTEKLISEFFVKHNIYQKPKQFTLAI